jgi:hypothetical protein
VRLRPLSEAECYARCYGARSDEHVTYIRIPTPVAAPRRNTREELNTFFSEWLDERAPGAKPGREAA